MTFTEKLLHAILRSLCGIAQLLSGVISAVFQALYIALPLMIIELSVCRFSYLHTVPNKTEKEQIDTENTKDSE